MIRVSIMPASSRADGADAPVHHVGRRDHVDAGLRLVQRLAHQHRHGFVVRHVAVADHPVMAVVGIRVQRHVADQAQIGECPLQHPRGVADQVFRVAGLGALGVLARGRGGGKQRHRRHPQLGHRRHMLDQPIQRDPVDTGHRADRGDEALPLDDEDRPDQVIDRQAVLGHQPACPGVAAVAAHADRWISADGHAASPVTGRIAINTAEKCRLQSWRNAGRGALSDDRGPRCPAGYPAGRPAGVRAGRLATVRTMGEHRSRWIS
jgi:hypothetical protein